MVSLIPRCSRALYMDAPEVDGKVYLSDDFDAKLGDKIWVQIIHADEYDVWGVRVEY